MAAPNVRRLRAMSSCGPTRPPRNSRSCSRRSKFGGTVTAGNASPYSDGAAALVLMKRVEG